MLLQTQEILAELILEFYSGLLQFSLKWKIQFRPFYTRLECWFLKNFVEIMKKFHLSTEVDNKEETFLFNTFL